MELITLIELWIVRGVMMVYDVITFPVYCLVLQPWKKWGASNKTWAVQLQENDPYSPYVRIGPKDKNPLQGISTMDELFRASVKKHGSKRCVGVREVELEADVHRRKGSMLKKFRMGEYRWFSFNDVEQRIERLSKSLLELGLRPKKQIAIFAETRLEWMLICQTCFRMNVPVATIYATLGEEGIIHALNETEVTHLFTSQSLLPKLKKIVSSTRFISNIVYMEDLKPAELTGFPDNISVTAFSQLERNVENCDKVNVPDPPDANDIAVIMYTSGSTGIPKGVMISHRNMVVTASDYIDYISPIRENDTYIAYLPLAHIVEMTAEVIFFAVGRPVGYSSPNTLTDKSTAVMTGCKGDATVLKPTVLSSVPLILDRLRKGVNEVLGSRGPFAKEFFEFAVGYKMFWCKKGFDTPLLNRLLFQKIKDMVGGNVRVIVSAGAPLSPDTQEFIRTCFGVNVLQAYAATETACSATFMTLDDYSTGRVGAPLTNCYIRLVDWPEGNYCATDKPNPRGEIVIGGDCVTLGYFKNKAQTEECFKEEDGFRWFYSGDVGELYPDGTFKIIDRKKDLVKLQHGEYISLGKVEAELKTCPLVDNICVVGNGFRDYVVALVAPNYLQLKTLASSMGKSNLSQQDLYSHPEVIKAVMQAIAEQGRKSKLLPKEIPTKLKLCCEEWLPEGGLVTAAFKIRRKQIENFYRDSIEEMFA